MKITLLRRKLTVPQAVAIRSAGNAPSGEDVIYDPDCVADIDRSVAINVGMDSDKREAPPMKI